MTEEDYLYIYVIVSLFTGFHLEKIGGYDSLPGNFKMNAVECNLKV